MLAICLVGVLMKLMSEEAHHSVIYSPMKSLSNILMVMTFPTIILMVLVTITPESLVQ